MMEGAPIQARVQAEQLRADEIPREMKKEETYECFVKSTVKVKEITKKRERKLAKKMKGPMAEEPRKKLKKHAWKRCGNSRPSTSFTTWKSTSLTCK